MSLSQKVAANTIIQMVAKAFTVFFTLLTTILLTGFLGKEGFGDYIYVITLVIMFGALADWGTATIGVRELAKEVQQQGRIFANILIFRLGLSFLAAVLLIGFAYLIPLRVAQPEVLRQAIILASVLLILNVLKASFKVIFQVKLQMQKQAVVDITTSILIFLISCFFVYSGFGLLSLIAAYLLATGAGLGVALFLALKTVKFIFVFDRKFLAHLIKESLPLGAILLMFTVDNKIDTVMLGVIKGSEQVGIYGVAYRIYDVLILGAAFFMNALLPVIAQYADLTKWRKKLQQIYQKSFDVLFLLGTGIFLVVWILAPLVIRILTWQRFFEFTDAIIVLRILILAMFFSYFNHLTGYMIVALSRQRSYFFVALSSLVFNVVANLIVIPRFSYWGAAWVTVLTEGLVLLITTIFLSRLLKITPSLVSFPKTAVQIVKKRGKVF